MTALADNIAARVRRWYEENRETWWSRVGVDERQRATGDAFILSLIAEVHRETAALTPPPLKPEVKTVFTEAINQAKPWAAIQPTRKPRKTRKLP